MIWLQAIREWLIIKLGGYVSRPAERIRIERVDRKIHKVCAMAQYTDGCPPWVIKREASKALAEEIVQALSSMSTLTHTNTRPKGMAW